MYPELFTIFGFTVSSFGLMMAIAFLLGNHITTRRMVEEGLDSEAAPTILMYVMLGGIAGAKLYYAVDVSIREGIPFADLLFSREGITWYGGLIGGVVVGAVGCRIHGVSIRGYMDCIAVALPIGQAIGRIGCFLVGDDYGRATDLPWGVMFPQGLPPTIVPVHPTQIYEVVWLLPVAGFLWFRRHRSPFLIGEYFALNGLGRIVIEHWRVNPVVALGMTEPQWIGTGLIVVGMGTWLYLALRARSDAES